MGARFSVVFLNTCELVVCGVSWTFLRTSFFQLFSDLFSRASSRNAQKFQISTCLQNIPST